LKRLWLIFALVLIPAVASAEYLLDGFESLNWWVNAAAGVSVKYGLSPGNSGNGLQISFPSTVGVWAMVMDKGQINGSQWPGDVDALLFWAKGDGSNTQVKIQLRNASLSRNFEAVFTPGKESWHQILIPFSQFRDQYGAQLEPSYVTGIKNFSFLSSSVPHPVSFVVDELKLVTAYNLKLIGPFRSVAGEEFPLTIEAYDALGNRREDFSGTVALAGAGIWPAEVVFAETDLGAKTIQVRLTKAGAIQIKAEEANGNNRGVSNLITVRAAEPSLLELELSAADAPAGDSVNAIVRASDQFGNPIRRFEVSLVSLTDGARASSEKVALNDEGEASFTFTTSSQPGVNTLKATLAELSATASCQGTAQRLIIQAPGEAYVADKAKVTVRLLDSSGQAVAGKAIALEASAGVGLSSSLITTDAEGYAEFDVFTPNQAGMIGIQLGIAELNIERRIQMKTKTALAEAVTLIGPASGAGLAGSVNFSWHAAGADSYLLRLSRSPDFSAAVVTASVPQGAEVISYELALEAGVWYWQVVPVDPYGNEGLGSVVRELEVYGAVPEANHVFIDRLVAHKKLFYPGEGPLELSFVLHRVARCRLEVYSVNGKLLWQGEVIPLAAGVQSLTWDGSLRKGRLVPGPYRLLVRAQTDGESASSSVLVLIGR
jgi:hypothetical protein